MAYKLPLPFETDYLSAMPEDEVMDLFHELEAQNFWDREERIQQFIQELMERRLSLPDPRDYKSYTNTVCYSTNEPWVAVSGYGLTRSYQQVTVKLPPWMTETQLRFYVEAQIREQMDPSYDPTDR
jgi:hypothetical protein